MQFDHRPIDFHQLAKPANLSNSAVLRMLEEEETRGRGQGRNTPFNSYPFVNKGLQDEIQKEIKDLGKKPLKMPPDWPPPSALPKPIRWVLHPDIARTEPGLKRVAWPPPAEEAEFLVEEPPPVYAQALGGLQAAPAQPLQSVYRPAPPPVAFTPPPSTITLRSSPPVSQVAAPVYVSQPITATVKGGSRSRGDQKWPPENVKQQVKVGEDYNIAYTETDQQLPGPDGAASSPQTVIIPAEAENVARLALAKGPACRPRKIKKDYSTFFAQHALNSTYPGYRPPPGTQHYIEEGTSNL